MLPDYDQFRRTTWEERIAIFSALSPEEKAELFRSQVSGWLDRHRAELTPPQVAILEEAIQLAVPEIYGARKTEQLVMRTKDLETRAAALLTRDQVIDALTMQWGMT